MGNSPDQNELDLLSVVRWIWNRKISYLIFVFLGAVLLVAYSYMVPKQFTAQVSLLPKIPVQKAGLLGPLASLTGDVMTLEGVDEELYGRVLHSNRVLDRLIERKWSVEGSEDSLSLFEVFHLENIIAEKGEYYAANSLKNILRYGVINFDRDPMNGVMNIITTVPEYPLLASSLANFLADELEIYNGSLTNQKTVRLRDFVENRLVEIQFKLEDAEAELAQFLQENIGYRSSPKLMQRYGELEREVQAFKTIWLQLRSKLENANIDVNKEIDSIIILDRALPPLHRSAPKRWIYLFFGGFIGFLVASVFEKLRT